MKAYEHLKVEKKWQAYWEKKKVFQAKDFQRQSASSRCWSAIKPKFYSLIEFPYPSGDGLHVGHPRPYIGMDIISRKRRMEGYNVLYPIGWDAFGLPTENYAIKTGQDPRVVTKKNSDNFRRQIKSLGISFDWSREINTTDPKYYKWTQWIFLQFLKKGLAYKAKIAINWCPKDKIGLANEEVIGGACERCGTPVEKREKEQWMLGITKYAERLDKDLDTVDYLPQIKLAQRNWIGKSEGAEIEFHLTRVPNLTPTLSQGEGEIPAYYTTDSKTWRLLHDKVLEMRKNLTPGEKKLWELLRKHPEHRFRRQHIINKFIVDFICLPKNLVIEVDGDIHDYQKERDQERTGILQTLGFHILRFTNNEVLQNPDKVIEKINRELKALPLGEGVGEVSESIKVFTTRPDTIFGATFIAVAPEVAKKLTGRDFGIKTDTEKENKEKIGKDTGLRARNPATGEEIPIWVVNYVSADYGTGAIMAVPAHDERDFEFAKKYGLPIVENYKRAGFEDFGKKITKFKLRDWVFSRQRYWGEPIPVIFCPKCGAVPVPDKDLPVELPKVKNYQPTESGESPLANIAKWVNTKCPQCKGKAKRETDTMPNWAGSSWYYLAYCMSKKAFSRKASLGNWKLEIGNYRHFMPVDWYNGGMEHTTLHLLYSRFWHKFLYDLKLVPPSEPYMKRTSHGLILAEGGEKMSKSRGNVINPDDIVKRYGADTLRLYEMFMGPFDQAIAWSEEAIIGPRRFLEKVWRIGVKIIEDYNPHPTSPLRKGEAKEGVSKLLHKTVKKVSEDIEGMNFNTAISSMMILVNEIDKVQEISAEDFKVFLKILSPFAPHLAEELWNMLGEKQSINLSSWPVWDEKLVRDEEIKIAVQVNGKVRSEIVVDAEDSEESVKEKALADETIKKYVVGKSIKKAIYVKGRLINIVL